MTLTHTHLHILTHTHTLTHNTLIHILAHIFPYTCKLFPTGTQKYTIRSKFKYTGTHPQTSKHTHTQAHSDRITQ
jgi:hypothetical protein